MGSATAAAVVARSAPGASSWSAVIRFLVMVFECRTPAHSAARQRARQGRPQNKKPDGESGFLWATAGGLGGRDARAAHRCHCLRDRIKQRLDIRRLEQAVG